MQVNQVTWDDLELGFVQQVFDNDWFGPGQFVGEFADELAGYIDAGYCQPVNSGSSALLLAVQSLINLDRWKPGYFVIHPTLTFPTSIAPAIQAGMKPMFVDVNPVTYQIDLDQVQAAIDLYGSSIAGAIVPHLLGNITDMDRLLGILAGRPLIEDCCDTLGGYYADQHVGNFGDVAAFSFYGSHHITTAGVGGALVTDDDEIYDQAVSMVHWGRVRSDQMTDVVERFNHRYWYQTIGYDMQMTELQAAFGLAQMTRLDEANKLRRKRWHQLRDYFEPHGDRFVLPEHGSALSDPSWFGFPITVKADSDLKRNDLVRHLIENKIGIRPIFTGAIVDHPAFSQFKGNQAGNPTNARYIGKHGLFLPSWGMPDNQFDYLIGVLEAILNNG